MTDADLVALCLYSEAAGEPLAGKRAVAQVILNRMALKYQSDGTFEGTVLHPFAFSGFMFEMVDGVYTRVVPSLPADTLRQRMLDRAENMLGEAEKSSAWPDCVMVANETLSGNLPIEPHLAKAVLYLNPRILQTLPAWATEANELCAVGRHTFYEDA